MAKTRRKWSIPRLTAALTDPQAVPVAEEPRVLMVEVDHAKYRSMMKQPERFSNGIAVEVIGETHYQFKDFRVSLLWQLTSGVYQRTLGVIPQLFEINIKELYFEGLIDVLDKDEQTILSERQVIDQIQTLFLKNYNEWKSEAMIAPLGMQPTHFSEQTPWGVKDLKAVPDIALRNFNSLVRHEGLHFEGCFVLEDRLKLDSGFMRGYASYRIGSDLTDIHLYLNWMLRFNGNDGTSPVRPEIALVEGENVPGLILAGAVLMDSEGNYFSSSQEMVHLFRLVAERREWLDGCVDLFMKWLDHRSPKTKTSTEPPPSDQVQLNLFDDLTADASSYSIPSDNEPDLEFEGKRVARVIETSSKRGVARILDLYQTKAGKWVAARQSLSDADADADSYEAKVFNTQHEVVAFFGMDQLAKNLYKRAKINFSRFI